MNSVQRVTPYGGPSAPGRMTRSIDIGDPRGHMRGASRPGGQMPPTAPFGQVWLRDPLNFFSFEKFDGNLQ